MRAPTITNASERGVVVSKRKVELVVLYAKELVTAAGSTRRPKRGREMEDIGIIYDGAVAARDGIITAVGKTSEVLQQVEIDDATVVIDADGKVVLPGLIDPHTHLVFAGSREKELEMKINGLSYMEILARGGGILETMHATRKAGKEELVAAGKKYLAEMLAQGTTTVEAKSGYGLNTKDELKMLEAIQDLQNQQPVDLAATFLGAHAVPPEFNDRPEEYMRLVEEEMLPLVAEKGLAGFCDVFCEEGVFSVEQSRRLLIKAKELGLKPKIHADEVEPLRGAELAVDVRAVSADHLVQISREGIERLASSHTIAVLLPATTFCLMGQKYAPARDLIEQGAAVALASDFNPGSSPVNSLQVVMGIACRQLKMKPAEVITAVTINAAHAIDRAPKVGSLEIGKQADIVIFDAPNYKYLPYRFGTNLAETVIKKGKIVWRRDSYDKTY